MVVIWQFMVNTPWWMYGLLIYLIYIGVKASKPHKVKLPTIFIIPLAFIGISLHTLLTAFAIDKLAVLIWLCATLLGVILGWHQIYHYALKIDKAYKLIQVPGTWSTLIILLTMFAAKYYFSYELETNSLFIKTPIFENCALIIFGIGTGFFIGKLFCYLYRFKTLKHSNLVN